MPTTNGTTTDTRVSDETAETIEEALGMLNAASDTAEHVAATGSEAEKEQALYTISAALQTVQDRLQKIDGVI